MLVTPTIFTLWQAQNVLNRLESDRLQLAGKALGIGLEFDGQGRLAFPWNGTSIEPVCPLNFLQLPTAAQFPLSIVASIWLPAWSVLLIRSLAKVVFRWRPGKEILQRIRMPREKGGAEFWIFLCNTSRRSSFRLEFLSLSRVRPEYPSEKQIFGDGRYPRGLGRFRARGSKRPGDRERR